MDKVDKSLNTQDHEEHAYEQIPASLAPSTPGLPAQAATHKDRPRIFQARDLPKGYVLRPKAFHDIKSQLLGGCSGQATAITTALRGAGGLGKTTLALALCHDAEIQMAFPDGILWVELGEHPPRPLDVLNSVLASLEPSQSTAITEKEARDRWRTALSERVCLLVIDDVWQVGALSPLLDGGPHCVRLVTTRNDQVLPAEATRLFVDAMEPEEAIAVLCQGLGEGTEQEANRPALLALARRLGCWPLLLTLAHGLLTDQVCYGRTLAQALEGVKQVYEYRGVTAFHLEQVSERHQTVEQCLEVSMRHLEESPLARYEAATRYQELAIFPEDTEIPLATLYTFWGGTGHLEAWEVDELCIRLYQLSLLLTCDLVKGTIRLHDVMRSYLRSRVGSRLAVLHTRFLDVSKQLLALSRWADLPPNEYYLWHYLVLHLCSASRLEGLQATLTDMRYLARKALYVGVPALEADLQQASRFVQADDTTSARPLFESLHRTMVRISHLLRQVRTLGEIGGLLLSHLGSQTPFVTQRHAFWDELPRPFLTAWHPLPSESSSALLRTLRGHTGGVLGCAVSPDGSFIVSASRDGTLKVWDTASGTERLTLTGHTDMVTGCAVSPDGSFIVSASGDSTLKAWDAATGAERFTLTGHTSWISGCAVSPDGSFIVSASRDGTLKVWDAATGTERLTLAGHTSTVTSCAVSGDGSFIVSASGDGTLKVWDAATGAERLTLTNHTDWAVLPPSVQKFHQDLSKIKRGYRGLRHTHSSSNEQRPVWIYDCAVSPSGRFIVSVSMDGLLKMWDVATGGEHLTLTSHTPLSINCCAVSGDGSFIVSASDDNTLRVWDTASRTERLTLTGHTSVIKACAVSADGSFIVSASDDGTLKVWDAVTEGELHTLTDHTHWTHNCTVSPDGSFIVSAYWDGTLKLWDAATGAERLTLIGHTSVGDGCVVSADGSFIVSASWDDTVKLWDAATGAERLTLTGHRNWVYDCAVSSDGSFIVSASRDSTLKVWDTATGAERLTLIGHTSVVNGCAVSPDGSFIVSASWDDTLKLWDTASGAERLTLAGHTNRVRGCTISPDGSCIVSASGDSTLKVWDAATGAERFTLTGHTDEVRCCAVSADGSFIASASDDSTLRVWDAQTGQCLLTFPVDGALFSCAFYPDGEHVVACGVWGMYFLHLVV